MKIWTKLAQANVNHYNNHPLEHTAIAVGYMLVSGAVAHAMVRKFLRK